jgi:hypothetical protein|tara:strand:+ start:11432 stop:14905 length:3474 start_codon:yes stop_codon:yes gene_type:complete
VEKVNSLFLVIAMTFCLFGVDLLAQGKVYEGPTDPAGDIAAEREGYMIGNRVYLYFKNTTELSDWPRENVSRWPNNLTGVKMMDGLGLLVGAKVYIQNNAETSIDTIPVTDPDIIASDSSLHELYFLQTSYREEMDVDPTGTFEYGYYPAFGYFNETSEYPAMSNRPSSWPPQGWPSTGLSTKWPGEWDGRFGRGVIYADLETYFVVNDAQDQEYLGIEDFVKYYPRPGVKIGDLKPNVSVGKGNPWGGLGLRVEARGFQWNNPQARDAIFWEYTIANVSDYDLTEVAFGYWVDNAIGNDGTDELAFFDTQIDMAYSWDINGIGSGGLPTGTMGFAYLESPGLPYDGIDNDGDGLIDEKRDNSALMKVGPTDGIDNLDKFLDFYKLTQSDLKEHWDADEDQDWQDGEDLNNDGIYQLSEFAGDDVGLDGVGPGDLNYFGPDEGEGNHTPDYVEGVGCEPNFAATDVSESDMVGLTAFRLFPIPSHAPSNSTWWFKNDKAMWDLVGENVIEEYIDNISNLVEVFASGPFSLYQGRVERISMSELHSYDVLEGLNSAEHSAPALYEQKKIVQVIYEKDYRFAQPPRMPTLTATPGDGKVILIWDNVSDTKTRDPFLGNINDFEGYKLFRATDKYMADAEVITDGYGTPMFLKPIFQCDIKDDRMGFTDFGLVNGVGYNLGSDTGIKHVYVDENVQNGRTYYYGLVAYDYGAPNIGPGIAPSENNIVIELDEAEEVRSIGKNVAIVTPRQTAAGYMPPTVEIVEDNLNERGTINVEVLANSEIKVDHLYQIEFGIDTISYNENYKYSINYSTDEIKVYDVTEDDRTLLYSENSSSYYGDNLVYIDSLSSWSLNSNKTIQSDAFDGLRLDLKMNYMFPEYDYNNSGWVVGNGTVAITTNDVQSKKMPWDYDIIFSSNQEVYTGRAQSRTGIRDEENNRIRTSELLLNQGFDFYVLNKSFTDSSDNYITMDLMVHDLNGDGDYDRFEDRVLMGGVTDEGKWTGTVFIIDFRASSESLYPKPDDVFRVTFKRPFWLDDKFTFKTIRSDSLNSEKLEQVMKDIKVVPNPYVATNTMEPALSNRFLNQRRRLLFTNIPASCTIKIFTVSGVLVDQIEVSNEPANGIVTWDMLTRENLEIAAGMYLFHVVAHETGHEKLGKFAVIK